MEVEDIYNFVVSMRTVDSHKNQLPDPEESRGITFSEAAKLNFLPLVVW